ncbi:ferredoxin-fold anticodon-binding domain-containing protein 1 [Melozone crissalis]|uniref:ferredoxin-fold anticodon-binding domain-containing protein 1 n=1 Tax=Melozone crissalis TaxID=40204 RepID=UPI0023DA634B|nr:ferredoxin-fold anticodon-binding domain-containing protein 1 [Melozone crissalis]
MGPRPRRALLLGEGNFSFAAALSGAPGTHVVATCYESEEEAAARGGAARSIRRLRDSGAEVVFSVDCTKLKEHFVPGNREFDRVYFNFPHCGRKAGVVKNRQLLAGFFHSCAEVLAQEGEVHVALCNGQGGTPADQPRREWHNSWQIVAVAAGAGFILSHVHPFKAETIEGYKCTGYRSQDKSFCVEGALNHIFTLSTAPPCFTPMSCHTQLGSQKVSFQVPQVLVDKMNRGFLEVNSSHPVRTIKDKLSAGLGQAFPLQDISSCLPLLQQGHPGGVCHSSIFCITLSPGEAPGTGKTPQGLADAALCSHFGHDTGGNGQEGCPAPEQFYLRPSLLPHAQAMIKTGAFSPGTLQVLSGPVFRKCRLTPHSMPAFHEMLVVLAVGRGTEDSCVQMLVENIKTTMNSLHQGVSGVKPSISLQEPAFGTELSDFAAFERQLGEVQHFLCVGTEPEPPGSCVGVIRAAPAELKSQELVVVSASLNLDLLAMLLCGISDWRMLWTWDRRFLRQFPEGELRLFRSFSLYPPSYVHDVSFWLPDGQDFDEVAFHSLARRVSGETAVSIQLRDSFQQPGTGRRSLCYRVTFQSCDRALGSREAAEMQLHLREGLQQHLGVTLR